jgi:hypothetical protein
MLRLLFLEPVSLQQFRIDLMISNFGALLGATEKFRPRSSIDFSVPLSTLFDKFITVFFWSVDTDLLLCCA